MRSTAPKVLCEVLFEPMLGWVFSSCLDAGIGRLCVVTGAQKEQTEAFLASRYTDYTIAVQQERRGTAHAVMQAVGFLRENQAGDVLVLCGDAPFMDAGTIRAAHEAHVQNGADATVITAKVSDPQGYGRIVRGGAGIAAIVEQRDCTPEQAQIREVNSGAYWFRAWALMDVLGRIGCDNAAGEYYLTDTVGLILASGGRAQAFCAEDAKVVLGANDRRALHTLTEIANNDVIDRHFDNGVEFISTDGVLIGRDVQIGEGTRILPGVILKGKAIIGKGCVLGPNTLIEDCTVGDGTILNSVQAYSAKIGSHVKMGPFVHIRPNSVIMDGVKIGDFVEVKNSAIGEKTSISHLTYVGDSDVGKGVNFGCGVVTVNYDGKNKHRTTIGDNAFIGCNTNLVAPVTIGNGAYTAAGSTITRNVPDDALAIERAELRMKEGYAKRKLKPHD